MLATLTRLFPLWALLLSVLAYYTPTTFHPNWPMGHHPADADHVRYGCASEAGGFQTRPDAPSAGRCRDLSPLSGDAARRLAAGAAVSYAAGAFRRDGAGRQRRQRDCLQRDDLSCQRGCGAVGDHPRSPPSSASWRHRCSTRLYVDAHIQVDVMGMLLSILQIVVIPIALGLIVHHLLPKVVKAVEQFLPAFSSGIAFAARSSARWWRIPPPILPPSAWW